MAISCCGRADKSGYGRGGGERTWSDEHPDADVLTKLRDDEIALLTVWQAHTAVRCRCSDDGRCEARQAIEDAIEKIQDLINREEG
jgi:hypothetical protein